TEVSERGAFLIHIGTFSGAMRISLLDGGLALAELSAPVWVESGDRFVVRDSGRQLVVAGGTILDPDPPRRRAASRDLGLELVQVMEGGADQIADVLLSHRGRERLGVLAAHSGGGVPRAAISADGEALSEQEAKRLAEAAIAAVAEFQASNRLEAGMAIGQLAVQLDLAPGLLREVVATADLRVEGSLVVGASQRHELESQPEWLAARRTLEQAGLAPPALKELGLGSDLLRVVIREGRAVRVSDDFIYLPDQVEEVKRLLRSMEGQFSVSDFRQRAGITRKHAVPILEWADREGLTVRSGDLRQTRIS
ncbi:MAG: SelB C-terminal domain-containing protein, partial [Acidimicrobiia bacterium]